MSLLSVVLVLPTLTSGVAGGLTASIAPAETAKINASVASGTGLSLSGAAGESLSRRSPTFVNLDVGYTLDSLPWLEFAPAIHIEIEGRVGLGVLPRIRAYLPENHPAYRLYASLGALGILHPYTLYGIQGAVGSVIMLGRQFALVPEVSLTGFAAGTDLMKDGALAKFDVSLAIRLNFQ